MISEAPSWIAFWRKGVTAVDFAINMLFLAAFDLRKLLATLFKSMRPYDSSNDYKA